MGDFFKTINAEVMATHKLIFDKIKPIFESEQSKDSKLGDLARLIEETKGKEQECYKFIQKTMTTSGEEAISDQDTLYLFHEYIAEAIPIKAQNLVANVAGLFSTLVRELRECEFLSCREFLKTYPMQSALDDYCQEDGLETAPLKEQLSQLYLDMKTSIEVIEEQYEAQRADQPRLGFFPLAQAGADADLSDAQGLKVSP